jgi:hypothetical protein
VKKAYDVDVNAESPATNRISSIPKPIISIRLNRNTGSQYDG